MRPALTQEKRKIVRSVRRENRVLSIQTKPHTIRSSLLIAGSIIGPLRNFSKYKSAETSVWDYFRFTCSDEIEK
jgi:hypothetical protein